MAGLSQKIYERLIKKNYKKVFLNENYMNIAQILSSKNPSCLGNCEGNAHDDATDLQKTY